MNQEFSKHDIKAGIELLELDVNRPDWKDYRDEIIDILKEVSCDITIREAYELAKRTKGGGKCTS